MTDGTTAAAISPDGYTTQQPISTEYTKPETAMTNARPVNLAALSEDDMRNLLGQIADTFVNHSRLAQQVAELTSAFNTSRDDSARVHQDLRAQLESMRSALIDASAERDRIAQERDTARREASDWQAKFNAESEAHHATRGESASIADELNVTRVDRNGWRERAHTAENANVNAQARIAWLEEQNGQLRDRCREGDDTLRNTRADLEDARFRLNKVREAIADQAAVAVAEANAA